MGKFNVVPSIDFDQSDSIDLPVFNPSSKKLFSTIQDADYNPFSPAPASDSDNNLSDWDKLYDGFNNEATRTTCLSQALFHHRR